MLSNFERSQEALAVASLSPPYLPLLGPEDDGEGAAHAAGLTADRRKRVAATTVARLFKKSKSCDSPTPLELLFARPLSF